MPRRWRCCRRGARSRRTQKELTEYLHTSYATTLGVIKRLAEKGFVERVTCGDDKRSNVIRLTNEALSLADECVREFRSMDELAMAGFTDEDEALPMDLLERLLANAEAIRKSQAN